MSLPTEGQFIVFANDGECPPGIKPGVRYKVHLRQKDVLLSPDSGASDTVDKTVLDKANWTVAQ